MLITYTVYARGVLPTSARATSERRALPKDLPPKSTVYGYFDLWMCDGTLDRIHYALFVQGRGQEQREASRLAPSSMPEGACIDPPGCDAGQKVRGKKRHILVYALGLLVHAVVHPAAIQDRERRRFGCGDMCGMFPFLKTLFADGSYPGPATTLARVLLHLDVEIVKPSDTAAGVKIAPKRWIVERTIARLNRCRRLAKDWKISIARRSPSCALLQFARCLESYAIRYGLFGRTLKLEMVRRRAMARMAVITKSFAPDFELCAALNRSVLDNSPDTVQHHIIVPRSDLKLFGRLAGPRTQIRCEADLLPRMFVRVPFVNITVNLSRPFPPVHGWIQQQGQAGRDRGVG